MRAGLGNIRFIVVQILLVIVSITGIAAPAAPASSSVNPRLSGFLQRLVDAHARSGIDGARAPLTQRGLTGRMQNGALLVPVILTPRTGLRGTDLDRAEIERRGARIDATSRSMARVWVPIERLGELAADPEVQSVREPGKPIPVAGLGPNVSESVALTGASAYQSVGITGAGIKVAVVDVGFVGLTDAINHGELGVSTVAVNLPGANDDNIESYSDHGTAVAEHVADMAPGSQIYCILVGDEVDLENSADYIHANGIRIANHSVAWGNDSYYDDTGPVNAIVNESADVHGVFWTVAAGNSAHHHWRGPWKDTNANNSLEFSGTDERLNFTDGNGYVYADLNWNQYGSSVTDLDLYAYDKNGTLVASSTDIQNGAQPPVESLRFFYSGSGVPYTLEVRRKSGPTAGLDVSIFTTANVELDVTASSIRDPADAHGAFALGAIDELYWNQANPPTEYFSSEGPTTDGRLKPDLAAPDGTTSYTFGPTNGYGTSFAAPTTAGAAALLLQQKPTRTIADLRTILMGNARDVGAPGPDPVYGSGMLRLATPAPGVAWWSMLLMSALLAASGALIVRRRTRRAAVERAAPRPIERPRASA